MDGASKGYNDREGKRGNVVGREVTGDLDRVLLEGLKTSDVLLANGVVIVRIDKYEVAGWNDNVGCELVG